MNDEFLPSSRKTIRVWRFMTVYYALHSEFSDIVSRAVESGESS